MKKIGVFAGSFDPFTIGHKDIVDRALESVADEVIVAIGINYEKKYTFSLEERLQAKRVGASFLLRGVRSIKDFEFERDMAEINKRLTGIETILLFTDPELACVSSSVVRELITYNKNVKDLLP